MTARITATPLHNPHFGPYHTLHHAQMLTTTSTGRLLVHCIPNATTSHLHTLVSPLVTAAQRVPDSLFVPKYRNEQNF